jgi:O-antigen ligase
VRQWSAGESVPVYARRRPPLPFVVRAVYYAFVLSLPFGSLDVGLNGDAYNVYSLARMLGYLVFAVALVQPHLCIRQCPRPFWYFGLYLLAFLFLASIQDSEYHAFVRERFFQIVQLLVLFRVCYNIMLGKRVLDRTIAAFVLGCVAASMLGLFGVGTAVFSSPGGHRYGFLTDDPNTVGATYGLGLLAAISLGHERRSLSRVTRRAAWVGAAVILASTLRTASRSALIALVAALLCLALKRKGKLLSAVLGFLVLAILVALSLRLPVLEYRFQQTIVNGNTSQREDLAIEGMRMFLEKPLLGWGPEVNVVELGRRFGVLRIDTHNLYIWLLTETGIVGSIPYIFALLLALALAWRARTGSQGILPFSMMIFLLFFNLGITWFNAKAFWVVLAYACASQKELALWRPVRTVLYRPANVPASAST